MTGSGHTFPVPPGRGPFSPHQRTKERIMKMERVFYEDGRDSADYSFGHCDRCGTEIRRYRGENDIECPKCGAFYNCFGQRLRDDLRSRPNPSEWDDEIGDLEGDEMSWLLLEGRDDR